MCKLKRYGFTFCGNHLAPSSLPSPECCICGILDSPFPIFSHCMYLISHRGTIQLPVLSLQPLQSPALLFPWVSPFYLPPKPLWFDLQLYSLCLIHTQFNCSFSSISPNPFLKFWLLPLHLTFQSPITPNGFLLLSRWDTASVCGLPHPLWVVFSSSWFSPII